MQEKVTDPLKLIDEFRSITNMSQNTMEKFLYYKVGMAMNVKTLKIDDKKVTECWGGLQMAQLPNELSKYLMYLYSNINTINTYCEIGVLRGGTFYVVDSFLRAFNKNFKYSVAVDISDKIIKKHGFEKYAEERDCMFIHGNSNSINKNYFDLCFIDGDHSYNGVKKDYENMKNKCKILAFHDVVCKAACKDVVKFWNEIKSDKSLEFINEDSDFPEPCGIGIL